MESMLSLSCERFSARKFTAEPVSQEDLEYIMKCVRMAPSACNKQPWRWLVVRSEAAKKQLQACYDREWFRTAPLYIVGLMNVKENWVRKYDNYPHGAIDVAIAAEHLCLAATDCGLGTCWCVPSIPPNSMNILAGKTSSPWSSSPSDTLQTIVQGRKKSERTCRK